MFTNPDLPSQQSQQEQMSPVAPVAMMAPPQQGADPNVAAALAPAPVSGGSSGSGSSSLGGNGKSSLSGGGGGGDKSIDGTSAENQAKAAGMWNPVGESGSDPIYIGPGDNGGGDGMSGYGGEGGMD